MTDPDVAAAEGVVAAGWDAVRVAFDEGFASRDELGASLAVYLDGVPVVDLWGGVSDRVTGTRWERDTVALAFSTVKGMTALAIAVLVEGGVLDVDEPVARYWPEFARNGKERVTVLQLLSHRAGLPAVDRALTIDDVLDPSATIIPTLAAQRPEWEPGTAHGYHSLTFGWLAGEVVQRVTGRSVGAAFDASVSQPLGLDAWIGRPEAVAGRCAVLSPPTPAQVAAAARAPQPLGRALADPQSLAFRTFANPPMGLDDWQRHDVIATEVPAATGIVTARAIAKMYAAAIGEVDGRRLVSETSADAIGREQSGGEDRVLGAHTRYGMGVTLGCGFAPMGRPECFGSPGSGGSVGFADPVTGLSFAYVPNRVGITNPDDRTEALLESVYRALGERRRPVT